MQSKPKSNSVITHAVEGSVVTFTVVGAGVVSFDTASASETCQDHARMHGFIQRISDAAAISRDPTTGKPATPKDKLDAMTALVDYYQSGASEWKRVREGGGASSGGLLLRCLIKYKPTKTREELVAYLKTKSASDKRALLQHPDIKVIADAFRAEAGKGVDVESLLGDL